MAKIDFDFFIVLLLSPSHSILCIRVITDQSRNANTKRFFSGRGGCSKYVSISPFSPCSGTKIPFRLVIPLLITAYLA